MTTGRGPDDNILLATFRVCPLQNCPDHVVSESYGVRNAWCEVLLNLLEPLHVRFETTKGYAVRPSLKTTLLVTVGIEYATGVMVRLVWVMFEG